MSGWSDVVRIAFVCGTCDGQGTGMRTCPLRRARRPGRGRHRRGKVHANRFARSLSTRMRRECHACIYLRSGRLHGFRVAESVPMFWIRVDTLAVREGIDFTLLREPDKGRRHRFVAMGDPQVRNRRELSQLDSLLAALKRTVAQLPASSRNSDACRRRYRFQPSEDAPAEQEEFCGTRPAGLLRHRQP